MKHLILGITCLSLTIMAQDARAETIGTVERAQNAVFAELAGDRRALAPEASLFFDEVLRTGDAARLEAALIDDTRITLGENATLHIDDFVFTPGTTGGSLALRVVEGAFLFVGGQVEGPGGGDVSITTPLATLGIRGTTVWGGPLDGGYGVIVLEGEVSVTTEGGSVLLTPGLGTMLMGGAETAPESPAAWDESRLARAVATISFDAD
ncbi:MAG: FecR domain-containing protein [Pararhodobacter sp.]